MIMTMPIRFDSLVQITYPDGSTESSLVFPANRGLINCTFSIMNGYDDNNNRVTNLVGYNGTQILKICPHCNTTKQATDFGYNGRVTNGRRDQSQCSACRSGY